MGETLVRECVECGNDYVSRWTFQKYCEKKCKYNAQAKRLGIALMYDPDTGVGTLKPSTDFMENDLMLQVDCLREWIYDLEQIHDIGAELLSSGKSVYSRGLFKELYDERTGKIKQF